MVYQDNKSAILLEVNGRGSSSKRTRHIDIRHFFVKDRIAGKEVSVKYCPTEEMVSDFFTKPLQGALFRKLRRANMNNDSHGHDHGDHRSLLSTDAPRVNNVLGRVKDAMLSPVGCTDAMCSKAVASAAAAVRAK
jgi:hypothetical protein